jgi:ferredoxin/DNA-binding transcriptional ArsR family regulator
MGHLGIKKEQVYKALAKRLDKNPVGAPLNEVLMQILSVMFSEKEAALGSAFPAGFTTVEKLSERTGLSTEEITIHLNNMADKGLVIDIPRSDTVFYLLSPLVVGFFEYTFMRTTGKLPLKDLADLFEQYHHEKGVVEEFFGAETKMFNTWAYESVMPEDVETEVLDYEKASLMIRDSGGGSLTMCYCRHQALHRGANCDAPIDDICMSLGNASEWLVRRGFARPATVDELLRVLEKTEELGLVHLADNVQKKPAYLCHCCGCCCGLLRSINEHETPSVHPSNFIPKINTEACNGCGNCEKRCHINAIEIVETASSDKKQKVAVVKEERCIGCGACIAGCKRSAMQFIQRREIYIPPRDKKEQMLNIARQKGKI